MTRRKGKSMLEQMREANALTVERLRRQKDLMDYHRDPAFDMAPGPDASGVVVFEDVTVGPGLAEIIAALDHITPEEA